MLVRTIIYGNSLGYLPIEIARQPRLGVNGIMLRYIALYRRMRDGVACRIGSVVDLAGIVTEGLSSSNIGRNAERHSISAIRAWGIAFISRLPANSKAEDAYFKFLVLIHFHSYVLDSLDLLPTYPLAALASLFVTILLIIFLQESQCF